MKHVVIVGGGFAGVGCALELVRSGKVSVTLVDRHNYHQFQPLFYQLATSQLAPDDVGFSLRKIFCKSANIDIKLAEVVAVDPKARSVNTKEGQTDAVEKPKTGHPGANSAMRYDFGGHPEAKTGEH